MNAQARYDTETAEHQIDREILKIQAHNFA
jgi:hypothetical protein